MIFRSIFPQNLALRTQYDSLHSNLGNKKAAFSLSPWVSDRFLAFSWTLVHFLTLKIVAFLALWGTLTSLLS